ncbi:hypothetical protein [Streptomyces sp. NPDC018833]|uniref:hypothetical protein n=1 Tax=Streptomyces sp. NPDC018833 TaxID=3365053 RepID=UPI0037AE7A89
MAQAEFGRPLEAVMLLLQGSRHRWGSRSAEHGLRLLLCVYMGGGFAPVAGVGAARVGKEVHQTKSEQQEEEQAPDRASPCPGSVAERLGVDSRQPWKLLSGIDLNAIVVTFLVTWTGAVVLWKVRRYDERYPNQSAVVPVESEITIG